MGKHRKNNTNSQNSISQSVLDATHHDILVQMPVSTMLQNDFNPITSLSHLYDNSTSYSSLVHYLPGSHKASLHNNYSIQNGIKAMINRPYQLSIHCDIIRFFFEQGHQHRCGFSAGTPPAWFHALLDGQFGASHLRY